MRISDIPEFKDKSQVLIISKEAKIIDCVKKWPNIIMAQ